MIYTTYHYKIPASAGLTERETLIYTTTNRLIDELVHRLPVNVEELCRRLGIRLIPLSWYEEQGMPAEEVFAVWGNRDGVASRGPDGSPVINYNDQMPHKRARFTLSEELMHTLLGHTSDHRFSAFSQTYSPEVYDQYEQEARTAAGLLLIPASFWMQHRNASLEAFMKTCDVSHACAYTTAAFYEAHLSLIRQSATKKWLSYNRNAFQPRETRRRQIVGIWPSESEAASL